MATRMVPLEAEDGSGIGDLDASGTGTAVTQDRPSNTAANGDNSAESA